jgi:hypothetical protein
VKLADHIADIRAGIKSGRFGSEADVSLGIVIRLLQSLGWPTYDTQVVCPEFSLKGRRVDFALCHPARKPVAFIEVKNLGQGDGAEQQLFEYAYIEGIPMAILTDGQEWHFFLPGEQGDYADRRVYKLDVLEREISDIVTKFERYLGYSQVSAGSAIANAREDYRNVSRLRQMQEALPQAWSALLEEEDDLLLELVADKVESLCGFKPDLDSVAKYLRIVKGSPNAGLGKASSVAGIPPKPAERNAGKSRSKDSSRSSQPLPTIGFSLAGRFEACKNGREVLVGVFRALSRKDPSFLERFAARPKHGRTRRYLARTSNELYPGNPHLAAEYSVECNPGWFLGTNLSHSGIERVIIMACEVAGIEFGRDLRLRIRE